MIKKILVADDSITIQKVIFLTLAGEEYEVTTVGDGTAAIDTIKLGRPDLVIADVVMPGKNGYEVCRYVKNEDGLRDMPVLLLAGAFEGIDEAKAAEAGADGHIIKPFESEELKTKIKELLGTGPGVAAEAAPPEAAPAKEEAAEAASTEAAPETNAEAGQESLTETIRKAMAKEAASKAAAAAATGEATEPEQAPEHKEPEEAPKPGTEAGPDPEAPEEAPEPEAPEEAAKPEEAPLSASTATAPETTATTLPGEDEPMTLTQRLRIAMAKEAAEKEAAPLTTGEEAAKPEEASEPEKALEPEKAAAPGAEAGPEPDQAAQDAVAPDQRATQNNNEEPITAGAESLTPEETPEPADKATEPEAQEEAPEHKEAIAALEASEGAEGKWNADDFVEDQLQQEASAQKEAGAEEADEFKDFDDPFTGSFTGLSGNEAVSTEQESAPKKTREETGEAKAAEAPPKEPVEAPYKEPVEAPYKDPREAEAPAMIAQEHAPAAEPEEAESPEPAEPEEAESPEPAQPPGTNEELSKEVTNEEFMGLNPCVRNEAVTEAAEPEEKEAEEDNSYLGGEDVYGYDAAAVPLESDPGAVAELGEPLDLGALGGLASLSNLDEPAATEPHPLEMPVEEDEAPSEEETTTEAASKPAAESIEDLPRSTEADPAVQAAIDAAVSGISREKIEEIVREVAEKVIEEVVWEVVPELSEQFIKTEIISKLKAAMGKIE